MHTLSSIDRPCTQCGNTRQSSEHDFCRDTTESTCMACGRIVFRSLNHAEGTVQAPDGSYVRESPGLGYLYEQVDTDLHRGGPLDAPLTPAEIAALRRRQHPKPVVRYLSTFTHGALVIHIGTLDNLPEA